MMMRDGIRRTQKEVNGEVDKEEEEYEGGRGLERGDELGTDGNNGEEVGRVEKLGDRSLSLLWWSLNFSSFAVCLIANDIDALKSEDTVAHAAAPTTKTPDTQL